MHRLFFLIYGEAVRNFFGSHFQYVLGLIDIDNPVDNTERRRRGPAYFEGRVEVILQLKQTLETARCLSLKRSVDLVEPLDGILRRAYALKEVT